jgi:RNA polymerase sigma-70 factor (ECF subfamily)
LLKYRTLNVYREENGMDNLSTEKLVQLCQHTLIGDTRAFETLVTRYKNRVYATAYRLMGNREEAEDQAQEVFLKIFRNIKKLNEALTFESWMHRITVNTCLDALEKQTRRPIIEKYIDHNEETNGFDVPSTNSNTRDPFEDKEIRNCLEKALAKLEPFGRSAIILRDIEELSYEEIAESLKIGLSAVKMRIHRARLAVQKLMEEICPDSWRVRSI